MCVTLIKFSYVRERRPFRAERKERSARMIFGGAFLLPGVLLLAGRLTPSVRSVCGGRSEQKEGGK